MVAHKPWQIGLSHSNSQPVCSIVCKDKIYSGCNGYIHETDPETGTVTGFVYLGSYVNKPSGESCDWDVTIATAKTESALIVGFQGMVFRLNPATLSVVWKKDLGSTEFKAVSLATSYTNIYAATYGRVLKLDFDDGKILHQNLLPNRGEKHVELCYGWFWSNLGVGTNGYFILLDGDDLSTIKQSSLDGCAGNRVDIAVGPERFYAASQGYIYEILPNSDSVLIRLDPTNRQSGVTRLSVSGNTLSAGVNGQLYCFGIKDLLGRKGQTLEETWNLKLGSSAKREPVHVIVVDGIVGEPDIVYASHRGFIYGYSTDPEHVLLRYEGLTKRGNGEVAMVAHQQYLVMGISGWLAYCPPAIANFELQAQEQTAWCWAAASSSIASYYRGNVKPMQWAQCNLADAILGQSNCCADGSTTQCNQHADIHYALSLTGNIDHGYDFPFEMGFVAEALSYARPLVAQVYLGTAGHGVVITGIHPNGTVDVCDPSYAKTSTISYDTLLNNYNGNQKWKATLSTK